jgi:hypothetical protein
MNGEYQFLIADGYSPATLPLERLAQYLVEFARLLGEGDHIHFQTIEEGSVRLKVSVDEPAQPIVRERVRAIRDGGGPRDARKAYDALDELLRKDNATGELAGDDGAIIIAFPGAKRPEPLVFGPFRQDCTLDGQIFRIGGKDETKHVHIRDGAAEFTDLVASEAVALRLRHYLFGAVLRFHGEGAWFRHGDGSWELRGFRINDFEELEDRPLSDVIASLRAVKGSTWGEVPNPLRELLNDRYGEGNAH